MSKKLLLLTLILFATIVGIRAQGITSSSIDGEVTNQKGEALPGTNIVATHVPSGTVYGAASRIDGRYNLNGLRVGGPYTVRVSFVGYKEQVQENIYLELGQTLRTNFKLSEESTELAAL